MVKGEFMTEKGKNKRTDERYKKVEGLLKLYPEIERRKENAKQFMKLGEDRSKELVDLDVKKAIVENMIEFLKDKDEEKGTRDYDLIRMWYFEHRSMTYIALELNMCEKNVWWRRRKIIVEKLISFMR